jgi:hypothetical protein
MEFVGQMTEPSLPLRDRFLLSPKTASYIDALIREGDKFDYSKWLQRVREGEAQAKQGPTTFISEGLVAAEIGDQTGTSDGIWPAKLMTRAVPIPRSLWQSHRAPKSKAPEISIRQRLEKIRNFRQAGLAMPCTDIWKPCLQSSSITKCDETPRSFCDTHSNLRSCPSTRMRIHLLQLFAARALILPIVKQSANGRERCGMLLIARHPERG